MKRLLSSVTAGVLLATTCTSASAQAPAATQVPVTADNFIRAETDRYFGTVAKAGGFGKIFHRRELSAVSHQTVVRANRDTLYSTLLVDLDAGPVTITLPDAGKRYRAMLVVTEDHYMPMIFHDAGSHTFTREQIGTRYALFAFRTLVDPNDPADVREAHTVQDGVKVSQPGGPGRLELPNWDPVSLKKVRDALIALNTTLPDLRNASGPKGQVDPVRHLIATASAWGLNPDKEAIYLNVTPKRNDGKTVHRLNVKEVPVDSFWSVMAYNADGYIAPNALNVYNLNNLTAAKGADGSVTIQFGGCDGKIPNCIPIVKDWNYMVRLYRPRAEILNDTWKFPEAQAMN
ncbi:carboxylesterase [Cupriavidus sp. UYMSc13B]|nr:carboxylesterase [Cupriavidus sp. UYMSc13B]